MLDNSSLSSTLATLGFSGDGTKNLSTNESNKSTLFGSDWMDSKWISACILHEKSTSIRNTNFSTVYALGWEKTDKPPEVVLTAGHSQLLDQEFP